MKCLICNKEIGNKGFSTHVKQHNMSSKKYYDTYLKKEQDGYCIVCGKPTKYKGIVIGYAKHCSNYCSQIDPMTIDKKKQTCLQKFGAENPYQSEEVKQKIKQTNQQHYREDSYLKTKECRSIIAKLSASDEIKEKIKQTKLEKIRQFEEENNCTLKQTLRKRYGQSWLKLSLEELTLNGHAHFIRNEDIPIIENYVNGKSTIENKILANIKTYYKDTIIHIDRTVIYPQELDIYIPKLTLAIEYNGIYWHSIEHNNDKDYHLKKSLLCREKGIRLIHIYEFEDLDRQLYLLKELILGNDLYLEDFNKNNFLKIPKSELIYNDGRLHIYGAGKLF